MDSTNNNNLLMKYKYLKPKVVLISTSFMYLPI